VDSKPLNQSVTDAIRYWEPRRLVYNAALAVIVVVYFWIGLPASKQNLNTDFVLGLFLLIVIGNACGGSYL
jgi:hypothetical protein